VTEVKHKLYLSYFIQRVSDAKATVLNAQTNEW